MKRVQYTGFGVGFVFENECALHAESNTTYALTILIYFLMYKIFIAEVFRLRLLRGSFVGNG